MGSCRRNKTTIFAVIISIVLISVGATPGQAGADTLDGLVAESLRRNPDVQAAEERWHVYEHKIAQASSLDDPRLSLALNNYPMDSLRWDQTPMTGEVVRLSQNLPFPGKLAARREVAAQQAAWYREAYSETRLQLIRQVKEAWFGLYLQERTLERTDANLRLLDDLIALTVNRYETGKGQQQDVLKAQVERSILQEKRLQVVQMRDSALAALNTLRNRPVQTPIAIAADLPVPAHGQSIESLLDSFEDKRPLARAYQALIEQYEAQQEQARLNYYPDFTIGAAYTFRQPTAADPGTDFGSIEFSINLPIYNRKRQAAEAEAAAAKTMARNQYEEFLLKSRYAIFDIDGQMNKNLQLISLYDQGILPQARQALEAAVNAYQVGRISFLALLDTMLTLNKYEVEYFRTVADHGRSMARLEAETGLSADWLQDLSLDGDESGARPEEQ